MTGAEHPLDFLSGSGSDDFRAEESQSPCLGWQRLSFLGAEAEADGS